MKEEVADEEQEKKPMIKKVGAHVPGLSMLMCRAEVRMSKRKRRTQKKTPSRRGADANPRRQLRTTTTTRWMRASRGVSRRT